MVRLSVTEAPDIAPGRSTGSNDYNDVVGDRESPWAENERLAPAAFHNTIRMARFLCLEK